MGEAGGRGVEGAEGVVTGAVEGLETGGTGGLVSLEGSLTGDCTEAEDPDCPAEAAV